ncbi:MAG: type II toxin-antitoxin system RelE/ParE family toxin [Chlorobi bacterium]|nr:type II toxin-antitoxin system RelE/ParE family toxin [Chlorobiota bacterium]
MKKIIWSIEAEFDYDANVDYLLREWTVKEAEVFVDKTNSVLDKLKSGKIKCSNAHYRDLLKCVICKQITLYYREVGSDEIELVRFWNNYQDKSKLFL